MTETNTASAIDWEALAKDASMVISALAPVLTAAAPTASAAIAVSAKIAQGVLAAEPAAVALYTQIANGTPPTQAQLQQFAADYETAYQQLNADIAVALSA